MERTSYSLGKKITGIVLHQMFTIVLMVSVFLLGMLLSKNILAFSDAGSGNFLDSAYYLTCVEEKCDDLSAYLYLRQKGDDRKSEENRHYMQYLNEFRGENSNFIFWYKKADNWYSNHPDAVEKQQFDIDEVCEQAKMMGNYLLYDMQEKQFSTDIRGLERYFLEMRTAKTFWGFDNVALVIGIDTEFTADDDLAYAAREYAKLQPWIKISILGAVISVVGWILSLVYLTIAAGHKAGEEWLIALNPFDRIKTEFLTVGFFIVTGELINMMARINSQEWDVSGLLVASGSIGFLIDTVFLLFYLSMVRRLKAEVLWEYSFVYWFMTKTEKLLRERSVTVKVVMMFSCHSILCFVLAIGAFCWRSILSWLLLFFLFAAEAYYFLRQAVEHHRIRKGVEAIASGELEFKIDEDELHGEDKKLAAAINNIGSGLLHAVDDSTKNERMKADLITNVSHDIKTPLTSIINYVNLLKLEKVDNPRVNNYVRILDEKSQRLKQLTEDLVEASRISSGNVKLDMQKINIVELVYQTGAEFNEKFEEKELTVVTKLPQGAVFILADGRQLYRVIENLYNNVAKYALKNTRVYVDIQEQEDINEVVLSIKNVSEQSLALENSQVADLTERFIRGETSRTTEGSGLGLSIAKNLTVLMGGQFEISVDGDLFKANVRFPVFSA